MFRLKAAVMVAAFLLAAVAMYRIFPPAKARNFEISLQPQSAASVPLTSEPSHHVVFSNDYVRVFRVEAAPGASTLVHRHDNDYFWVAIGPSDITNSVVGKEPVHAQIADNEVRFVAGGFSHSVTNNSRQPFRNFTIEVLRHGSRSLKPGEDEHEISLLNSGSIERLLLRDGIRASEIELKPGASFSRENPDAHLVLALAGNCRALGEELTPEQRRAQNPNAPDRTQRDTTRNPKRTVGFTCIEGTAPGGFESQLPRWLDARETEQFRNDSSAPARLLILDF